MKVKIEIDVAVDENGSWSSVGFGRSSGATHDRSDMVVDGLEPGERWLRLVAEVDAPVPRSDAIQAEVQEVEL